MASVAFWNCKRFFITTIFYQAAFYMFHNGQQWIEISIILKQESKQTIFFFSSPLSHDPNLPPFLPLVLWILQSWLKRDIPSAGKYFFPICTMAWWILCIHFSNWWANALIMSLLCKKVAISTFNEFQCNHICVHHSWSKTSDSGYSGDAINV